MWQTLGTVASCMGALSSQRQVSLDKGACTRSRLTQDRWRATGHWSLKLGALYDPRPLGTPYLLHPLQLVFCSLSARLSTGGPLGLVQGVQHAGNKMLRRARVRGERLFPAKARTRCSRMDVCLASMQSYPRSAK